MTADERDAEKDAVGVHAPGRQLPELPELPELTDERIDELEAALFAAVAQERQESAERERHLAADRERRAAASRRKRRGWFIGAGAAAAVVVVLALAPSLARLGGGGTTAGESAVAPDAPGSLPDKDLSGGGAPGIAPGEGAPADGGRDQSSTGDRDIIATASATVRVDDVAASATAVGDAAQRRGGYVESMNVGQSGAVRDETYDPTYPAPPGGATGAWITVRVPADQLTAAIDDLSTIGKVEASSITRQDVTTQAVDLRARVDALQASVDRLTELMSKSGSVADLIAAETALSQRQADLESLQQQLKALDDQVSMSTLTVSLVPHIEAVEANPAGFGDGLATGWNGLVATLNGLVIALGFLLPWLAVLVVLAVVVWVIVRLARPRRAPAGGGATGAAPTGGPTPE